MEDIKTGKLKIGDKLPTERELSQKLKVSRNTISTAYNLLEQEGVLISYQGRGTYVAEEDRTWKEHTIKDKMVKLIDIALEEAIEVGLDTKEFVALVQEIVKEKESLIKNVNAIFVECNIEQAKLFTDELNRITNLHVVPMTVAQLQNRDEVAEKALQEARMIITAFNHVNEIRQIIDDLKIEVFGVASNPSLETIVKIAKYPKGTKFGQVCLSKEFYLKVQYALKSAGLENLSLKATISKDEEELLRIIEESHVIIASPGRGEEVERLAKGKKEIIKFNYVLDQGSVKAILSKILEIKRHF